MQKKTILLVEDDEPIREMIKDALEVKYCVFAASTCSEALDHNINHADLALIDYALPDGDGLELSRSIRRAKPALPIIIMTGFSTEELAISAVWTGVTGYIKKPFRLAHLMGWLSEIFGEQERRVLPESEAPEDRKEFLMEGITTHINNSYSEDLTLDRLAAMAHISKSHFCRVFRDKFGMTTTEYINRVRASKAAELLMNSHLKVSEIACSVGFECIKHFNCVFKEVYGTSPSQYRRTHGRNEPSQ